MLNTNKNRELSCALKALMLKSSWKRKIKKKKIKKIGKADVAFARLKLKNPVSVKLDHKEKNKKKKVKNNKKI